MKFISKILISALSICLFACGTSEVKISQLLFNEAITNAYYKGKAFTGSAWSEDGKSISIECVDGKVTHVTVYHDNGEVALQNTQLADAGKSFDEDGNPITMQEFVSKYPDLVKKVKEMADNMYCSPELK